MIKLNKEQFIDEIVVSEKVVVFTGYVRLLVFDLSEHIYVMIVMCSERYTF